MHASANPPTAGMRLKFCADLSSVNTPRQSLKNPTCTPLDSVIQIMEACLQTANKLLGWIWKPFLGCVSTQLHVSSVPSANLLRSFHAPFWAVKSENRCVTAFWILTPGRRVINLFEPPNKYKQGMSLSCNAQNIVPYTTFPNAKVPRV
jgi:hypothetical protein